METVRNIAAVLIVGWAVIIVAASAFYEGRQPACHDGYYPLFIPFEGWLCVAAHKPESRP